MKQLSFFDYAQVNVNVRKDVKNYSSMVREHIKQIAQSWLLVGKELNSLAGLLPRDQFISLARIEHKLTPENIDFHISAYKMFETCDIDTMGHIPINAVKLLVRDDTPREAGQDAVDMLNRGEDVDREKALELIRNYVPLLPGMKGKPSYDDLIKGRRWNVRKKITEAERMQPCMTQGCNAVICQTAHLLPFSSFGENPVTRFLCGSCHDVFDILVRHYLGKPGRSSAFTEYLRRAWGGNSLFTELDNLAKEVVEVLKKTQSFVDESKEHYTKHAIGDGQDEQPINHN